MPGGVDFGRGATGGTGCTAGAQPCTTSGKSRVGVTGGEVQQKVPTGMSPKSFSPLLLCHCAVEGSGRATTSASRSKRECRMPRGPPRTPRCRLKHRCACEGLPEAGTEPNTALCSTNQRPPCDANHPEPRTPNTAPTQALPLDCTPRHLRCWGGKDQQSRKGGIKGCDRLPGALPGSATCLPSCWRQGRGGALSRHSPLRSLRESHPLPSVCPELRSFAWQLPAVNHQP